MRACSRFIAGIFAILFIITAVVTLLLYNLDATLLTAEAYKRAFIEEDIYVRLPGFVGQQIQYGMEYNPCAESPDQCEGDSATEDSDAGPPVYFRILSEDDWEYLIVTILDPEWIQITVESVLDQVFENLGSNDPPKPISISLVSLKTKLKGPIGYQTAMDLLEKQPDCTLEQVLELTSAQLLGGEIDDFLLCKPPEILDTIVDPLIREATRTASSAIPDEITFDLPFLGEIYTEDPEDSSVNPIHEAFALRRFLPFTPLIPITFLLLMTLFAVRSLRDWFLWWGVPVLLVGLISLIYSMLSVPIVAWIVPRLIREVTPAVVTPELFSVAIDIGTAILRQVTGKIVIQAGVLSAIGLGFIISAYFVKPASRQFGEPLPEN